MYREKVVVPATKPYITLEGAAGRGATVIEWHDRASDPAPNGEQLRTYRTASVTVLANYFTARNISFKGLYKKRTRRRRRLGRGCKGGRRWRFGCRGTRRTSWGAGSTGRRTRCATTPAGITSKTATSRDPSTSSSATEGPCTK
ncbi:unnamed protein product [Linum tenue]|uniref:Pectinesterase n=1 Tax=Linum tenue TaxID=586396 RepID=A0AAV0K9L5_9ROSI|nr:unnamed protein product [Linum tenue]